MPEVLVHKGNFIENKMIQRLSDLPSHKSKLKHSSRLQCTGLSFILLLLHSKTLKIFMTITVLAVSLALSFC